MIIKKELFNLLTDRQKLYFKMMNGQSGVLYITAEPGVAKSAIMKTIAKKLGLAYFDVRLSMVDEIDVGLFPYREEMEIDVYSQDKEMVKKIINVMSYAIPRWAYNSNVQPSLIHFEELNRAPLAVRNAALQILLDRQIGTDFIFNENVYMCASGNLGDEDGTDVEEFDAALNNRLIHFSHSISLDEWINDFAIDNIHNVIISFLKTHDEHFIHHKDEKKSKNLTAYATPRSWTFLSDYIKNNYGLNAQVNEFIDDIRMIGASYVGDGANSRFIRYLDETLKFGINDLLNRYDEIIDQIKELNRDKKSEFLNGLRSINLYELNPKQMENVKKFILSISEDESIAFILRLLDDDYKFMKTNDKEVDLAEQFLTDERFVKFYDAILNHVPDIDQN
jgi:hypothetical protein